MKIHKPFNLSFLYKVFEAEKAYFFCGALIYMFSFQQSNRLFADPKIWKFAAKELGKDAVLDMIMPKPNGEVLVTGSCHAGRNKVMGRNIQLRLGPIEKTLSVFGDRHWIEKGGMSVSISDPVPFESVPINYQNAFGGEGFAKNPLGKGAVKLSGEDGRSYRPLPNVESPRHLIGSESDTPDPAGFGPLDMTWPQRMARVGTYDQKWLREFFPGLAEDTDMRFFNLAPEDQWLDGYFKGDEPFAVEGMHPEKDVVLSRLPGFKTRMFILKRENGKKKFSEIPTNMDTLWLFPHVERGIAIHHGVTRIATDDAEDVLHGVAAYERLDDEPRTPEHYLEALKKRLDKKKRSYYHLYDKDLIPHGEISGWEDLIKFDMDDQGPLTNNMIRRAEREREKALIKLSEIERETRTIMEENGLDPSLLNLELPPMEQSDFSESEYYIRDMKTYDPERLIEIAEKAEKEMAELEKNAFEQAESRKEEALQNAREVCQSHGLDFDDMIAKASEGSGTKKRPIMYADETLAKIRDAKEQFDSYLRQAAELEGPSLDQVLAASGIGSEKLVAFNEMKEQVAKLNPDDPELREKLEETELATKEAYREGAHLVFKVKPTTPEKAEQLLETFESTRVAGASFEGVDLAGIDLSGKDLSGMNLSGVFLEGANLSGTNLSGADLNMAILAHADLTGAKIEKTRLTGANLGRTRLNKTRFVQSDLEGAVLSEADFTGSLFKTCKLNKLNLIDSEVDGADFGGCSLKKALFLKTKFRNVSFRGANMFHMNMIDCVLDGVDFREARVKSASFVGLKAENGDFRRSDFTRTSFLKNSKLAGANFREATLERVNFMEADLESANLTGASLNQANLMKSNLVKADLTGALARYANFTKADLEQAVLVGTDLMYANLRGARFTAADLQQSNMYSAEVLRAVFGDTNIAGANLKMTKIREWDDDTI